jgi:hypothetical protein
MQEPSADTMADAQDTGSLSEPTITSLDANIQSTTSENIQDIIKDYGRRSGAPAKTPRQSTDKPTVLSKHGTIEFVNIFFGKDELLGAVEKFMSSLRLWNLRFDAYCEEIIKTSI